MSKTNDQPMDEKSLDSTELDEISGGEACAYEAPEVAKIEYDNTNRDNEQRCQHSEMYMYDPSPFCMS